VSVKPLWRSFAWRWLKSTCLGVLFLSGGIFVTLLVSEAIGYLPYSDRPGPGWYAPHWPNVHEIAFFASFSFLVAGLFNSILSAAAFLYASLLSILRMPRWMIGLGTAIPVTLLALLGAAANGWMIAIAAPPIFAAGIFGCVYAGFVIPHLVSPGHGSSQWWHWTVAVSLIVFASALAAHPLLPDREAQNIDVVFVKLAIGDNLVESGVLTKFESDTFRQNGWRGKLSQGPQVADSIGGVEKRARVLVVMTGPLEAIAELAEPDGTTVIYFQEGPNWRRYPPDVPVLKKKIILRPLSSGNGISYEVRYFSGASASDWSWDNQ
jgi:hypothetical protein